MNLPYSPAKKKRRITRTLPLALAAILAIAAITSLSSLMASSTPSLVFTAAGDHGANVATEASLNYIAGNGASFHLALGDMSYSEVTPESAWCDYVKSRVGETFPFQLVVGNHEHDSGADGSIGNFAACLPDRMGSTGTYGVEYYFDASDVRFIIVAPGMDVNGVSYEYRVGTSHYDWLSQTIDDARSQGISWIVVGMHLNCITIGNHGCGTMGEDLMNLLINKRVDLVVQGHEHNYQRSKQLSCASADLFRSECVADSGSDGLYSKGLGTVFVIVGTFGIDEPFGVDWSDSEAGYFAAAMDASTPGGGNGFVKFSVYSDRIDAEYIVSRRIDCTADFSDSFSIVDDGTGQPPPFSAQVSALPVFGNAPLSVSFQGQSSGGLPPYSYLWDFGDGTTSSEQNLVHTFNEGNYSVVLTVSDQLSSQTTANIDIQATAPPPPGSPPSTLSATASATPTSGEAPLQVSFQGSGSGGVPPYSYLWDFGDGTSSTVQNPFHTFDVGDYTVTLTVTDQEASQTTATIDVQAVAPPPSSELSSTYILTWEGNDYDSRQEVEIFVNGVLVAKLPAQTTSANNDKWVNFSLDITEHLVSGTNTITFNMPSPHSSKIRNLEIVDGNGDLVFSDPTRRSFWGSNRSFTWTFQMVASDL